MSRLRLGLLLVVVLVWGRVVQQIVWPSLDLAKPKSLAPAVMPAHWEGPMPSPFPETAPRQVRVERAVAPKEARKRLPRFDLPQDSSPPPVLQAILWGPDPVAILGSGGETELLHRGQSHRGWLVAKIAEDRVLLRKGPRRLELLGQ